MTPVAAGEALPNTPEDLSRTMVVAEVLGNLKQKEEAARSLV